jgi:RNA polymerase sigma factor (sigma-70 family)
VAPAGKAGRAGVAALLALLALHPEGLSSEALAEVAVQGDVVEPTNDAVLECEHLLAAIRELPVGQRAVLVLRFLDDLSVAETAAAFDCSQGTVKSQTSRALDRIRGVLDRDQGERRC